MDRQKPTQLSQSCQGFLIFRMHTGCKEIAKLKSGYLGHYYQEVALAGADVAAPQEGGSWQGEP